jgi:hypothetical protein
MMQHRRKQINRDSGHARIRGAAILKEQAVLFPFLVAGSGSVWWLLIHGTVEVSMKNRHRSDDKGSSFVANALTVRICLKRILGFPARDDAAWGITSKG